MSPIQASWTSRNKKHVPYDQDTSRPGADTKSPTLLWPVFLSLAKKIREMGPKWQNSSSKSTSRASSDRLVTRTVALSSATATQRKSTLQGSQGQRNEKTSGEQNNRATGHPRKDTVQGAADKFQHYKESSAVEEHLQIWLQDVIFLPSRSNPITIPETLTDFFSATCITVERQANVSSR